MNARNKKQWTDDEVNTLIRLRDAGIQRKEIAEVLGRSVNSVHQKIINLNISGRKEEKAANAECRSNLTSDAERASSEWLKRAIV
ncbi:hypothetical protein [Carnimonas bestiolae]|uniref:hypothetical protein n=1 Tax=Carnimonas bestiolae TaxID=3402172 RepID=UPI003EDBADE2